MYMARLGLVEDELPVASLKWLLSREAKRPGYKGNCSKHLYEYTVHHPDFVLVC
jgi:hypothetical protein